MEGGFHFGEGEVGKRGYSDRGSDFLYDALYFVCFHLIGEAPANEIARLWRMEEMRGCIRFIERNRGIWAVFPEIEDWAGIGG